MSDKLKNLIVRTLSGIVLLVVVLGASMHYYTYALLLYVIAMVGMLEFYKIADAVGCRPQRSVGVAAGASMFCGAYFYAMQLFAQCPDAMCTDKGVIISLLFLLVFVALSFVVEIFKMSERPLRNIAATLLGVVYVALPMSVMLFIPQMISGGEWQPWCFLFYLFIVWGNDIFAYLVGITLGRHRLCERISPKKSWEGFVGGIVGALAVGAVGAYVLNQSYVVWLGLAVVVAISAVLGDLVESMFKREAGVKDSGKIMPGHGGMLDRFDALMLSSLFACAYLILVEIIVTN